MILKDITLPTPEENILYDEVLLSLAEQGAQGEVLRFWESSRMFIVLGRIGKIEEDVFEEVARKDGVPILRRFSGGGTVIQGPGCLNYTLVLKKDRHPQLADLHKSYEYIFSRVVAALRTIGVEAEYKPISDLVLKASQKKFSGNAQHRGKNYILHHGTFLCGFGLPLVERYLKIPREMPEYRQSRSHREFVINLNISPAMVREPLIKEFSITSRGPILTPAEAELLQSFRKEKSVRL